MTRPFPHQPPSPPWRPSPPWQPGQPGRPEPAPPVPGPGPFPGPAVAPGTVGGAERGAWPARVFERLLDQRIVFAHGFLDGEAATRLSAQLLTLDAEGTGPVRLELQGLDADLPAALSVMGVMDVLRVPVSVYAGGRIRGPALGIVASAGHRWAYPNAIFVLCEPAMSFDGTVSSVTGQEEQARALLDQLFARLAELTGREADQVRADAAREKLLDVAGATAYGLIEGPAGPRASTPGGFG